MVRIHPGQLVVPGAPILAALGRRAASFALGALLAFGAPSAGQVASDPPDPEPELEADADPDDVEGAARAAQTSFERRRLRYLPLSYEPWGDECDEHVGRFCTSYDEGEWYPVPEDPEIGRMRAELIRTLDSLQLRAPENDWVFGQRVWYRGEAGRWDEAARLAAACGGPEPWWCAALEGLALHASARYERAGDAFARALEVMDEERRRRWTRPRWPVDSGVRDAVEDAAGDPEAQRGVLERVWALADPLYLVPGNDRHTVHLARWTVATLREGARTPFRIRWADDLAELTVRHGWEVGWERTPTRSFSTIDHVVGHKHPEGRDYMPPGEAVESPVEAEPEALTAGRRRPRSLYAPEYAPVLLPIETAPAVFPRIGGAIVVATPFLPEDTSFHAGHDHPRPWMEPGDRADQPDRIGLFVLPVDSAGVGGEPHAATRSGVEAGALAVRVPQGDYVASAESWSPSRRRAGRHRAGLRVRAAIEDVATLSALLLLTPGEDPGSLEAALDRILPRRVLAPDDGFEVAWEVAGLGFRRETLHFEISVERQGRSVFRRVGEFLGLADRPQPLELAWEEPSASEPGVSFHAIDLDLPRLDPGRWRIRLVLRTADRSPVERTLDFEVREASDDPGGAGPR